MAPTSSDSNVRTVLLTITGGDRATAYVMKNKICRRHGNLVCTWLDNARRNWWAIVDAEVGEIVSSGPIGPELTDNHCGASMATGIDGSVHLIVGAHFGAFIHYRLPLDRDEWTPVADGGAIGEAATYPSTVCDQEGTLHLTYRSEPNGRDARLHYCRRPRGGPWSPPRVLAEAAVSEHSWLTNAIDIGPNGRLHVVISNTLPMSEVGPEARYYGVSHLYSDDSGETWRQFGIDRPLALPVPGAELKRIEADGLDPERIEKCYGGEPGPCHSYYRKILLSNPAVDDLGRPWAVVTNVLSGEARLYGHDGSAGWTGHPLLHAVQSVLPGFRICHSGQVSRGRDGGLDVVLMAAPKAEIGWGANGTTLVWLRVGMDGCIHTSEVVSPPRPDAAQWLPSLERFCWHAPVERPALLYTSGLNAGGYQHNVNSVPTEVWVRWQAANALGRGDGRR